MGEVGLVVPRSRRVVAGALGLVVAAATALFTWHAFGGTQLSEPRGPAGGALASIAPGWTKLPDPPQTRNGSASVWADTELIDWGGDVYDSATKTSTYPALGYAFDPATSSWKELPPAPSGRAGTKALWTGTEALFLFGWNDDRQFKDGFAFDPALGTWRTISASPLEGSVAIVTWTGSEVIAWGGGPESSGQSDQGATYDPATDTWKKIATAPHGLNLASGVWTGHELIVFGSMLDNRNHADTDTSVGASYDPMTDTWHELPPSSLSPQATSAVWTGDRMIAWDYEVHSQEYDPIRDRWTDPTRMPLQASECYPDSVAVPDYVFVWYCGDAAVYDVAAGTWTRIHGGMLEPTIEANGHAYQLWRFADLIPAENVIFFEAEGITVDKSGSPCYGCSGSPTSFWAYRPAEPS